MKFVYALPFIRYNGQKIMYTLMAHDDFEKMLNKHVSASMLRNIQDKLDTLKRKGLNETPSARTRRSGQGSRSSSATRGGSASRYDIPFQDIIYCKMFDSHFL